jgi:hypothetical protein
MAHEWWVGERKVTVVSKGEDIVDILVIGGPHMTREMGNVDPTWFMLVCCVWPWLHGAGLQRIPDHVHAPP